MSVSTTQASAKKQTRKQFPPSFKELRASIDRFVNNQNVVVEATLKTAFGTIQGGGLGYLMGTLMESSAKSLNNQPGAVSPMMQQMQATGGPLGQAKGLAALCGVSSGLSVIIKRLRNGKEDIWNQMAAAAGGGAAYTVASGTYSVPAVVNSAILLGLVTGGFYKLTESFKPQHDDKDFERSEFLLKSLGFSKYTKNLKKGLLTDNTIMLWNENTLQEVRIPPGPRLLILHHINQLRNVQDFKAPSKRMAPTPPVDKRIISDTISINEP